MTNHQSDAGPRPAAELPAILSHAIAAHQGGDLGRAESLYHVVLRRDARQFDALHMLGVLAGQRRDFAKADRLIRQALNVDPKRYDQALTAYHEALAIRPNYAEALKGVGNVLWALQSFDRALVAYDKAL